MGKVHTANQAGWRHINGSLAGTTCTATLHGKLVNHTQNLFHSTETFKECLLRKGEGGKASVRLGGSHAHLTSHPAVTFICFHVYLKKIKGMIAQE